jgi:Fe2+ or Zn2+ uptake regulation protein
MDAGRKSRMTRQRKVILEEVEKADCHPSADAVYVRVRRRLPRVSLGTVYRNLEVLSEAGLIRSIDVGDGHRHYDAGPDGHFHVRCVRCGRIEDVAVESLGEIRDAVRRATGYCIQEERIDFTGICPECSKKEEARDTQG